MKLEASLLPLKSVEPGRKKIEGDNNEALKENSLNLKNNKNKHHNYSINNNNNNDNNNINNNNNNIKIIIIIIIIIIIKIIIILTIIKIINAGQLSNIAPIEAGKICCHKLNKNKNQKTTH